MPTINKLPKKNYKKNKDTQEARVHRLVYDTSEYRQLRKYLLMVHPLCQVCNRRLSTAIHHIQECSKGVTDADIIALGMNPNNCITICEECHKAQHNNTTKKPKK